MNRKNSPCQLEFSEFPHEQSADIAMGVDGSSDKDEGAGDQGLMFGYACRETDVLMPAAIHYSHQILQKLAAVRKADADSILGPDSKARLLLFMMTKDAQHPHTRLSCLPSTRLPRQSMTSARW